MTITLYQKPSEKDLKGVKHWRVDPAIAGCGYFCDLAPHMLDFLQYCLGEINSATGYSVNQLGLYDTEDIVSGLMSMMSGVQVVGIWNFNAYDNLDRTEIIGDQGKIIYATFNDSPVILDNQGGIQKFSIQNPRHIQQPMIQAVVDELRGKGRCPSTGLTASRTSWVMDQILEYFIYHSSI